MLNWFAAAGLREAVDWRDTSGIAVTVANTPRAVCAWALIMRVNSRPSRASASKLGVAPSGLPSAPTLWPANDSSSTSTTFGGVPLGAPGLAGTLRSRVIG